MQVPESNATLTYRKFHDPLVAVEKLGQMFAASGMFGCTKVEQGQVLALACLVEGKSPFELMRNYHIIGGNLSMRSAAILAEFMKKGGKCVWRSALNAKDKAVADFSIGENELPEATYSIEDAQKEGLVAGPNKHNWNVRPADMLRARLITKAVRMIAPGIVVGVLDETETAEVPPPLLAEKTTEPPEAEPKMPAAEERQPKIVTNLPLEAIFTTDGLDVPKVIEFLVSLGLLQKGENLSQISNAARDRILGRYLEFKEKFAAWKAATPQVRQFIKQEPFEEAEQQTEKQNSLL
jgi:hypothetical protein